jgi:hypothetical protein
MDIRGLDAVALFRGAKNIEQAIWNSIGEWRRGWSFLALRQSEFELFVV